MIPGGAVRRVPGRIRIMQIIMMKRPRRRYFKNVDFGRPAVLEHPERGPCSELPRSLEPSFDVAVLHRELPVRIDSARCVIGGTSPAAARRRLRGVRVTPEFSLDAELAAGDRHIFRGAVRPVIVRMPPVVSRIPLGRIQGRSVEFLVKDFFPAGKRRRRIRGNSSGRDSKRTQKRPSHETSEPTPYLI